MSDNWAIIPRVRVHPVEGRAPMIYKILAIVADVCFGVMTLALVGCLAWSLASQTVQAGFDKVSEAVSQAVEKANEAMGVIDDLKGLVGGEDNATGEGDAAGATGDATGSGDASDDVAVA